MREEMKDLGLSIVHIGINNGSEEEAGTVASLFSDLLGLPARNGSKSVFVGEVLEIMKMPFRGVHGHIALQTPDIMLAIEVMERCGYSFDMHTLTYDAEGVAKAVYLNGEIGGFALHLLRL